MDDDGQRQLAHCRRHRGSRHAPGFLVSRDSYGDFELRAEVWARPESNGGILFRITDARDPGIQNAYELNYDLDRSKIVALVNIGAAVTNINVLSRGQTVFWRDISFGGNQFTEALQREFSLSFENAEARALAPSLNLDKTLKLPPVVLKDLGAKQGGAAAADIANQVLRPIVDATVSAATREYVKAQKDKLGSKAKDKAKEELDKLFKP